VNLKIDTTAILFPIVIAGRFRTITATDFHCAWLRLRIFGLLLLIVFMRFFNQGFFVRIHNIEDIVEVNQSQQAIEKLKEVLSSFEAVFKPDLSLSIGQMGQTPEAVAPA